MANYKELYDLSIRLFFEEKSRFNRIDQKASWYFSALTLLMGVTAFFAKWMIETLLPPKDGLDVILVLIGLCLIGAVGLSWFLVFSVLRVADLANIPLDEQTLNLYSSYNDATIYWVVSQSVSQFRDENLRITDRKSKILADAYRTMISSIIIISVFGFLFAGRVSLTKTQPTLNTKGVTTMCKQDNKPTQDERPGEQPSAAKPAAEQPDTSVPLLKPQFITEGYDPKLSKTGKNKPLVPKTGQKND